MIVTMSLRYRNVVENIFFLSFCVAAVVFLHHSSFSSSFLLLLLILPPSSLVLQKGDHPELDTTPFLDEDDKEIYQSLIGCGQWNTSIGRFDTQSALMSMSRYRTAHREGHLERVKRIYGCLRRFRHFKLHFRVDEPDYSNVLAIPDHDWEHILE